MIDGLTAQEAAKELGYHLNHVYRLLKDGVIKGERYNRSWVISKDEVERIRKAQDEHGRFWR